MLDFCFLFTGVENVSMIGLDRSSLAYTDIKHNQLQIWVVSLTVD